MRARPADRNFGSERSAAGLHASRDSLYRTARGGKQDRAWVTEIPLALLPRPCPLCGNRTIIGHRRRLEPAHDQRHARLWIRRGRCRPCRKTFTILPAWSPPYGQYSLYCRQQAWVLLRRSGSSWERSIPDVADAVRSPDPSNYAPPGRMSVAVGNLAGNEALAGRRLECCDVAHHPCLGPDRDPPYSILPSEARSS